MSAPRPIVIDASVALALLLEAPEAPLVAKMFRRWVSEGRTKVVPTLFWLEVLNRLRREPGATGADLLDAVHRLDTYELQTVDMDRSALIRWIDHVERHRLSSYDATYLVLAEDVDGELATFDGALATAAGFRAFDFDDGHRLHERPAVYEHEVTWPRYKEASAFLAKLRSDTLAGTSHRYERPSPSAVPGPRR